jgi:hypothetical protein
MDLCLRHRSPSLPNFGAQDDNSLAPPARAPHHRTRPDPALDLEQALRALENQIENAQKQWRRHREEKVKAERNGFSATR